MSSNNFHNDVFSVYRLSLSACVIGYEERGVKTANDTLNLFEAAKEFSPEVLFIFTSTNKVYGDTPNRLPPRELSKRWEIEPGDEYEPGMSETMSIDYSKHSLFEASKAAADLLVQEYGRYFGLSTVSFRGGCLTGPADAGTELHGFPLLNDLRSKKSAVLGLGIKGKQIRDNIRTFDLVEAFVEFIRAPRYMSLKGGKKAAFFDCSR